MIVLFRRLFTSFVLLTTTFGGGTVNARAGGVSATPTIVYTAFHETIAAPVQSAPSVGMCAHIRGCYSTWVSLDGFTVGDPINQSYTYPGGLGGGFWMLSTSPYSYFAIVGAPCPADGTVQATVWDSVTGESAAFSAPVGCSRVLRHFE